MTQTEQKPVASMKRQELVEELEMYRESSGKEVPFNESMPLAGLRGIVAATRGEDGAGMASEPAAEDPEPEPQEPPEPKNAPAPTADPPEAVSAAEEQPEPQQDAWEPEDDPEIAQALELHEKAKAVVRSNPGSSLPAAEEFSAAMAVADRLANSKVVPRDYQGRPDDVLAAYLFGRELGLGIMTSLRDLYMIDGRASIAAHRQLGIIRAGGVKILESEATSERAYIKAERRDTGEVMAVEFTMEQARKVTRKGRPLVEGDNWKSYPEDMLWARCVGRLSRRLASDILGGSLPPYVAEEVADFEGWGVEYGSQGQLSTKPVRQEQPAYNTPQSWNELRSRLEQNMCPGQPETVEEWIKQAAKTVAPEAESVKALSKEDRDRVWVACSAALYELEQIGLDAVMFHEDPRSVIATAFSKHLEGQMLEGPPWRVGPKESDLPEYQPAAEEVTDAEIIQPTE